MRKSSHCRALSWGLCLIVLLGGCVGVPAGDAYDRLVADLQRGRSEAWDALPGAVRARSDLARRLERLATLSRRAADLEPSATATSGELAGELLDAYYGDLHAHEMAQRAAIASGAAARADHHLHARDAIVAAIATTGDGSAEQPYDVLTSDQALAWLSLRGEHRVGAVLMPDDDAGTLTFAVKVRRDDRSPLQDIYFDLSRTLDASNRIAATTGAAAARPSDIVAARALQGDTAAQVSHALTLWQTDPEAVGTAIQWLQAASESGNVVAQTTLGVIYGALARSRDDESGNRLTELAVDQFLLAVAQGSTEAMFNLAQLYLSGYYGEENQPAGVALLHQAADRDNGDAMLLLARLKYFGQYTPEDRDGAVALLRRASALGHHPSQLFHARLMLAIDDRQGFDEQAMAWLTEAASVGDEPEAMLLLASLIAEGDLVERDVERARAWFKRAADRSDDAEIVNTVVWTLTVTEQLDLRDPSWARERMERLMTGDAEARGNPAYLDTWAATYAATGDFERAVSIQKDAVAAAIAGDDGDVRAVLEEHLEMFERGETVTEVLFETAGGDDDDAGDEP